MFDSMKSSSLQIMPLLTNLDSPHSTSHNSKAKMQSPTANEAFFYQELFLLLYSQLLPSSSNVCRL
jgi:hypothetical protein